MLLENLNAIIYGAGGAIRGAVALDKEAVNTFVDGVAESGSVDISFNLIGVGDIQKPLMELSTSEFLQPITITMQSHFVTTRAAARHMIPQASGVILAFGGSGPQTFLGMGSFKIALDAFEGHRRQWAAELGPYDIRVVTLKTGGVPESIPDGTPGRNEIAAGLREMTLLNRTATMGDVANVAAFVASNRVRTMTSSEVNISCGAIVD